MFDQVFFKKLGALSMRDVKNLRNAIRGGESNREVGEFNREVGESNREVGDSNRGWMNSNLVIKSIHLISQLF